MIVPVIRAQLYQPGQFVTVYSGVYLCEENTLNVEKFLRQNIYAERLLIKNASAYSGYIKSLHLDGAESKELFYNGYVYDFFGEEHSAIQEAIVLMPNQFDRTSEETTKAEDHA